VAICPECASGLDPQPQGGWLCGEHGLVVIPALAMSGWNPRHHRFQAGRPTGPSSRHPRGISTRGKSIFALPFSSRWTTKALTWSSSQRWAFVTTSSRRHASASAGDTIRPTVGSLPPPRSWFASQFRRSVLEGLGPRQSCVVGGLAKRNTTWRGMKLQSCCEPPWRLFGPGKRLRFRVSSDRLDGQDASGGPRGEGVARWRSRRRYSTHDCPRGISQPQRTPEGAPAPDPSSRSGTRGA
jgi:hypothetical protein